MARRITILTGSMTGTAELVAEEIEATLTGRGVQAETLSMADASPELLTGGGEFIVCTSTYGSGDVPDNARNLFDRLTAERPVLSNVRYAVFGLGDSTYQQTYGFGGQRFDTLLAELGAARLAPLHVHNASGGTLPEDDCVEWTESLLDAQDVAA